MTEPEQIQTQATGSQLLRKDLAVISNVVLYLTFCVLAATGLALAFKLDHDGARLFGVMKRDWARVHTIAALSVLSLVVLHLWVNWPWIRPILARQRWTSAVVVLVGLVVLALALLAPVR